MVDSESSYTVTWKEVAIKPRLPQESNSNFLQNKFTWRSTIAHVVNKHAKDRAPRGNLRVIEVEKISHALHFIFLGVSWKFLPPLEVARLILRRLPTQLLISLDKRRHWLGQYARGPHAAWFCLDLAGERRGLAVVCLEKKFFDALVYLGIYLLLVSSTDATFVTRFGDSHDRIQLGLGKL